jgi:CRISPR-associated protein Csm4
MKAMTVYLRPHSTLRGRRPPRSDTLFGAICWAYQLLFGGDKLAQFLLKFNETSTPFLVSSIFEYTETNHSKVHYFPKPLTKPYNPEEFVGNTPSLYELEALKKLKKMRIMTDDNFTKVLSREKEEQDFYEEFLSEFGTDQKSKKSRSKTMSIPHNAINRLTWTVDEDHFFYTEEFSLASATEEQRGLFFCVKCDENIECDLKTVFYFLADKGIGGKTSVGKGHFKSIEIDDKLPYTAPPDEESTHVVTLSLTYPDPELRKLLPESWYTLEKRQGKIESMYAAPASGHIWKDHLLMLQEGSTFPKTGQRFYGGNPIVRKAGKDLNFDIYQYGYAFTVNTRHVENMRPDSED